MPKVSRRHAIARLGRAVSDQQPTGRLTLETATVTAVDVGAGTDGGDVVTVDLYGGTPAPHLASYSPTVGDVVWVLLNNGSPAILGHFVGLPNF